MTPPVVLAIAGTDSSGGAGLAADLTTFAAIGVHGAGVVTAVTAQNTTGVHAIHPLPLEIVAAQLDAVLGDLPPVVVKTGMLGTTGAVRLVAERCAGLTLVVDPVLRSSTGTALASEPVVSAYREYLLPVATVVTPNIEENSRLRPLLPRIVTGSGTRPDVLHRSGHAPIEIPRPHVPTANDHGTGCTYASALAAYLALGADLLTAATRAADFVTSQLRLGAAWNLGRGRGPVPHTIGASR